MLHSSIKPPKFTCIVWVKTAKTLESPLDALFETATFEMNKMT